MAENFQPALRIGTSKFTLTSDSIECAHKSPHSTSPNIVVMDWEQGAFRWRELSASQNLSAELSRSEHLRPSTPSDWLRGFIGDLDRPKVSVGLKLGKKRSQAKGDRSLVKQDLVFVQPPPDIAASYTDFVKSGLALQRSALGVTHTSEVYLDAYTGRKGFGGANKLVADGNVEIHPARPPYSETNFVPLCISVDTRNLYFLPHVLVVQNGLNVSANSYDSVRLQISEWNLQVQSVPQGAEFLGYVWKFMNKDGGPDRRYNNNYQIPVIRTWEVDFEIEDAGELHLAFSDRLAVTNFSNAFTKLQALSKSQPHKESP
jgi:hypothetical protein